MPEAVPVVRAILVHREQVPRHARHRLFEVLHQRGRLVGPELAQPAAVPIGQPANLVQARVALPLRFEQVDDGVQAFIVGDEVARLFCERPLRKRSDVSPEHQDASLGNALTDGAAREARASHVLRRRRRLMPVDDNGHEPGFNLGNAIGDLGWRELEGFGVHDLNRVAAPPHEGGNQPGPNRILDGSQSLSK